MYAGLGIPSETSESHFGPSNAMGPSLSLLNESIGQPLATEEGIHQDTHVPMSLVERQSW